MPRKEVSTPESQVPLAPGRVSLVGTPVNLVSPGAVALKVATEQGEKQIVRDRRESEESLRVARSLAVQTGTVALEGAKAKAIESADPDAVFDVYEETISDQLTDLSVSFRNERDKFAFDIQMENRMRAHSFDLAKRVTELTTQRRIAALGTQMKTRLDSSLTTNPALIELNKRDQWEDLNEMVQSGVLPADKAQGIYESFASDADLNYIQALINEAMDDTSALDSEKWKAVLEAVEDDSITPDLSVEGRVTARSTIITARSREIRAELSVGMDRGKKEFLGEPGRFTLDELRNGGILTATDYRELSRKLEQVTGDSRRSASAGELWKAQEEFGITISPNDPGMQDAVNFGFQKFLNEKSEEAGDEPVNPVDAAIEFTGEWGQIPEMVWSRLGAAMSHTDIKVAAEGAEAAVKIMRLSTVTPAQMRWTGAQREVNSLINEYQIERWGGIDASRQAGAIERLDPQRAMQVIRDRQLAALGEGTSVERDKKRRGLREIFGFEEAGLELAKDAFNAQDPHFWNLKAEDVPKGLWHNIMNNAIESMIQGTPQEAAFYNAAQDQIIAGNLPTNFNGVRSVETNPLDQLMPAGREPGTNIEIGHEHYRAEGNLQVLDLWADLSGDEGIRALMQELAQDRFFTTGLSQPTDSFGEEADPGLFGSGSPFHRKINTLKYAMEFIALRTGKPVEVVWAALNQTLFPDAGPGTTPWELMQVGDTVTRNTVDAKGEPAGYSWLMVAITPEGNQFTLTTPGSPRGYRISYDDDILNPILAQQVENLTKKDKQSILNKIREQAILDANTIIDFGVLGNLRRKHLGLPDRALSAKGLGEQTNFNLNEEAAQGQPALDQEPELQVAASIPEQIRQIGTVADGAVLKGLTQEMVSSFAVIAGLLKDENLDFMVTSGVDRAEHRKGTPSYHPIGMALDIQVGLLSKAKGLFLEEKFRRALGDEYIVIFETMSDGKPLNPDKWHFHVQLNTVVAFEAFEDFWGVRGKSDTRPIATDPGGELSGPTG